MAETKQGAFEIRYHHIDAPTVQDDEYGKQYKKRKLMNTGSFETYREPLVALLADKEWVFRRKIDGANIRIQWDGEQALWNGKTDKFVCGSELTEYMNSTFIEEIFEEKFGRDVKVVIFGEHMGPKVQGNELKLDKDEVIIYDVNINGFWQPRENVREIASYFGGRTCYDVMSRPNELTPEDVSGYRFTLEGLINVTSAGFFNNWEGVVATPTVECRNQKNERIIVKVKVKDYYREEENGLQNV